MSSQEYLPFQRYDDEFQMLTKQVVESLEGDTSNGNDHEQSSHTGALISQCDELLQQMALEARSVDDTKKKRDLLQQVRNCKSQLQTFKDQHNKQVLMAGGGGAGSSNSHRQRLLDQQDQLERQNSRLENARKVMEETEQVALEIGDELASNRETIQSAHGRIHQVTSLTGRARRIVQNMNRRAVQQKILLYGISASIIVAFLILLWLMRRR